MNNAQSITLNKCVLCAFYFSKTLDISLKICYTIFVSERYECDESEENNMNNKTKIHHYKGFDIIKDGKKNLEWNIYKPFKDVSIITGKEVTLRHWVGCGRRIIDCKTDIDNGCFEV